MEKIKQFCKRYWQLFPVLLFLLVWGLYVHGDIGISKQAMLEEQGQYLKEVKGDYLSSTSIGDSMAAFLSYSVEEDDYDLRIYVRRKNTIGWFFRYGRSGGAEDTVYQYRLEENGEYVLVCLSTETAASRIEIDKGNGTVVTITPEENKPFAYVMSRQWLVVVYTADGSALRPVERSL